MKFEKSAGAIVFRESGIILRIGFIPEKGVIPKKGINPIEREYLLLAHKSMSKEGKIIWDFPKGLIAEGESERQTAEREVSEETGLSEFSFIESFRETLKIFYKYQADFINKTVVYFLSKATSDDVHVSLEHTDFSWLGIEEAKRRLTFKNSREILQKAEDFLNGKNSSPQLNLGF